MKRLIAVLFTATALLVGAHAQDPLRAPFGHQTMKALDGGFALGSRRHLVILLDDDNNGTPAAFPPGFGAAYYQSLVFNLFAQRENFPAYVPPMGLDEVGRAGSVNGYLVENSRGRFSLAPAIGAAHPGGVIGPLFVSQALSDEIANDMPNSATQTVQGRVALDLAVQAGLVLADFDDNTDGFVTNSELTLIVVKTRMVGGTTSGGENRGLDRTPPNQPNGATTRYKGQFIGALRDVDFATLAHEITHTFGTNDIYSVGKRHLGNDVSFNFKASLMGATISSAYDPKSFHLDCWHKMALGWCEPRIVSIRTGGQFTIPAAQSGDATNPLLIYDPVKGPLEYFMLEYRTASVNSAHTYDGDVAQSGVFLWHIQMHPNFPNLFEKRAINIESPWILTQLNSKPGDAGHPIYVPNNALNAVWTEGPTANNAPGINTAWQASQTSNYLRWNDGSITECRFRVHPFNPGDTSVTVEILSEYDTWVDFTYGGVENGEFNTPYNTMYEGAIHVGWGGKLKCKGPRSGTLSIILDKPMTITAEGGPVTISEP